MISILILTKDEEADLPGCLESVAWCDDIHVFDSCSTDRTSEIARDYGAHLAVREFDNYAAQRNAALDTLPFRYPWLFLIDADERSMPELADEIQAAVRRAPADVAGFRLRRRDFLNGTWLKHAQLSPWHIRLIRRGKARYTRNVNEILQVDGKICSLEFPLDHYPFSKGIGHWLAKHNRYSGMEADLIVSGSCYRNASFKTALFEKDFHKRRVAQKALFYRVPARPAIKWAYMMFVRGAFLDGVAGIRYANLQALYEWLIVSKARERVLGRKL